MKQNPNSKVLETKLQPLVEQQPHILIQTMQPRSNNENIQNSYERTIKESKAARQSAQNLQFQEKIMEKNRFKDQMVKVKTIKNCCLNLKNITYRILKI